ncbi:MAG TPA: membrane protein insertase YidC [Vicinamibacterales bacterium]|nr:membrane protein insertase YidC [Vicinamibacterales bacterium]
MERRFFIAILLSIVVLYGYQALFVPPPPASSTLDKKVPAAATPSTAAPAPETPRTPTSPDSAVTSPPAAVSAAVTSEATEREIVVETTTVKAVLSNRGGRLVHWRLKGYRDKSGAPLDLVPSGVPKDQHRPFSLVADDATVTTRLNDAVYKATGDSNGRVDATSRASTVVFEFQDAAGLHSRKEFRFDSTGYFITFSAHVTNGDRTLNPSIAWGPGLGDIGASSGGGSFFTGNYVQPPQAIFFVDKVQRVPAADVSSKVPPEGTFKFAGIDDHYFLAVAVNPGRARLSYQPVTLPGPDNTERKLLASTIGLPEPPQGLRYLVGPKQFDLLQSVDKALGFEAVFVRAINFGTFSIIATPLLTALRWVHGFVGNWGWSIIVLTILINLAIFPLRHKSVVSMRKMQVLQPKMKAIQDRYAGLKVTDPERQKMNTEIMSLYRQEGVNPASGCVPMLLTLPVLFAFYSLLSQAIELRGASFGWWITDLSERDPYYITPVLMALTMFWQQRVTPSTADPAQQRVMMMMPLMFGVMFLAAPSGLVLYWFVGNLFAIGQQYFTNWWIGPPAPALARPPAERRIKSAGAGRTAGAENKN